MTDSIKYGDLVMNQGTSNHFQSSTDFEKNLNLLIMILQSLLMLYLRKKIIFNNSLAMKIGYPYIMKLILMIKPIYHFN